MRHRGVARARPRCRGFGPRVEVLEQRALLTAIPLAAGGVVATISGTISEDVNGGAGSAAGASKALAGWVVYADTNGDGSYTAGEPIAMTNPAGRYTLTVVSGGTYTIREVIRDGWYSSVPFLSVSVSDGQSVDGQNIANSRYGSIAGTIFNDQNADGTLQSGEPGLAGWKLYIDLNHDGSLTAGDPVAVSDASGNYSFTNLKVGSYTVLPVAVPSGWQPTRTPTAGYFVASGAAFSDNWGFTRLGIVRGTVFSDDNINGSFDAGESVFKGWTVYADLNKNGSLDAGEPSSQTQVNGSYTLGLAAGNYSLREVVPSGYQLTTGTNGALPVSVSAATTQGGMDFGNLDATAQLPASVSGSMYNDVDGSGRNPGFVGALAGWRVYADLNNNGRFDIGEPSALTDTIGAYTISDLPAGQYTVAEVPADNWYPTVPATGSRTVSLAPGDDLTGQDFGNAQYGSVNGTVYNDANADGTLQPTETGVAGFQVFFDVNGNQKYDPGEPVTTTDAKGHYTLKGLTVGQQLVGALPSPGWRFSDAQFDSYSVFSGSTFTRDWGMTQYGAVPGVVYQDVNGNGAPDAGDTRLDGATVYADLNNNGILDTNEPSTQSANGGWYQLSLPAGGYTIRQIPPHGFVQASPAQGSFYVIVHAAQLTGGAYFGDRALPVGTVASISGTVFQAQGTRGQPQPPLAGWRVYADLDNDGKYDAGEPYALTDANGNYTIVNLTPGSYLIREVVPDGWTASTPLSGARPVTLSGGQLLTGLDFGNLPAGAVVGSVTGTVFADANHDGLLDGADAGLAGITVFLDTNNNNVLDYGETSTVTGADGTYRFSSVPFGTYAVREVLPTGYVRTAPVLSNAGVTVTSDLPDAAGPVFADAPIGGAKVDMAMLLAFAQHFNGTGTFMQGDLNGDDKIDFRDLVLFAQNYNKPLATVL